MTATLQLSRQLTALSDSLKSTNALITQLAKLSFQPGSESLETDQSSVRVELSQDIHDSLKQLEEDLELLKQEAEDLNASTGYKRRESSDKDRDRARLTAQVARLTEDLKTSRSSFRRAQLTAKKASEAAKQKERELVFASLQNDTITSNLPNGDAAAQTPDLFSGRRALAQKSKLTKEELELDAASTVTASLRRTHDLLSTELSRSRFAQETFEQSTAALQELGERYSDLGSVLDKSRELLGTLLRSQKSDTWYLETAFYILIGTLCWLIFRRILLGPFIRLPLFLLNWFLWKPFVLFLSITGILTPAEQSRADDVAAGPRTPLIVKNSARGSATPVHAPSGRGVPVGAGGKGAKVRPAPEMVEKIGRMAEESAEEAQQGRGSGDGGKEEVRRGDGTVLQERGDEKPNPKKRVFEADVEEEKRAEAEARGDEEGGEQERKRDEL